MTKSQVERLLGKPEKIEDLSLGKIDFKRWIYNPGEVYVDFNAGRMEKVVTEKDREKYKHFFDPVGVAYTVDTVVSQRPYDLTIFYTLADTSKLTCNCINSGNELLIELRDTSSFTRKMTRFKVRLTLKPGLVMEGSYTFTEPEEKVYPENTFGKIKNATLKVSDVNFVRNSTYFGYFEIPGGITNRAYGRIYVKGYFNCQVQ